MAMRAMMADSTLPRSGRNGMSMGVIVCRKIRAAALLGAWLLGVRTEGVDWDMHPPPLPEKLKGASHPPEARPGLSGSARGHVGLFFGTQISWRKTSMRYALVIIALTLSLVGCSKPKSGCAAHSDEASCTADKACNWNSDKNKCKKAEAAPKAEAPAPQAAPTPAPTPAPAPQIQAPAPSQPEQAPAEAPHPAPMAPPAPNNQ
jgi:hypothetical protein